jgi:hypothetical protein
MNNSSLCALLVSSNGSIRVSTPPAVTPDVDSVTPDCKSVTPEVDSVTPERVFVTPDAFATDGKFTQ